MGNGDDESKEWIPYPMNRVFPLLPNKIAAVHFKSRMLWVLHTR